MLNDMLEALRNIAGDDDTEFMLDLLESYQSTTPDLLAVIKAADGEAEALGNAAHQLKSSSAMIGCTGFSDQCGALEKACKADTDPFDRAALARAIALDPDILFFDEPSAGLDPISSRLLDELIVQMQESLGATVVMVTHELPSIFDIASNSVYLDASTRTMIGYGNPAMLRDTTDQAVVRQFLTRGPAPAGETSNE